MIGNAHELRHTRTRMNIGKMPSNCSFCPLVHLLFDRKKKQKLPARISHFLIRLRRTTWVKPKAGKLARDCKDARLSWSGHRAETREYSGGRVAMWPNGHVTT